MLLSRAEDLRQVLPSIPSRDRARDRTLAAMYDFKRARSREETGVSAPAAASASDAGAAPGGRAPPPMPPGRAPPVTNLLALIREACAVCLEPSCARPTLLEACMHVFCFQCIAAWARVCAPSASPACPLCKAPFEWGIVDARSEFAYERVCLRSDGGAGSAPPGSVRALLGRFPHRRIVYLDSLAPSAAAVAAHGLRPAARRNGGGLVGGGVGLRLARGAAVPPRLAAWLPREVEAAAAVPSEFLVSLVLHVLERFGSGSPAAAESLERFLGQWATRRFLRELEAFVASGLGVDAYDRVVTYSREEAPVGGGGSGSGVEGVGSGGGVEGVGSGGGGCATLAAIAEASRLATRLDVAALQRAADAADAGVIAAAAAAAAAVEDVRARASRDGSGGSSGGSGGGAREGADAPGDASGAADAVAQGGAAPARAGGPAAAAVAVRAAAAREYALRRAIAEADAELAAAEAELRRTLEAPPAKRSRA